MATLPFTSRLLANVGISMGDEGKGRVAYELINDIARTPGEHVSAVIKVNGGANSGHTAAGLKLNLLPSGITEKSIEHLIIASGVVADPRKLAWEAKPLEALGHNVLSRLRIDERTQFSDLTHRLLDLASEYYRSTILHEEPRGSTGRGISPAFADEVTQNQIFYSIFKGNKSLFAKKLQQRAERAAKIIEHVYCVPHEVWEEFFQVLSKNETSANKASIQNNIFPASEFDFTAFKSKTPYHLNLEHLIDTYWKAGQALVDNIVDIRELVLAEQTKGHTLIGEFGQSFWLDKRFGFTPNVTASHTFTPEFFLSIGIPIQKIHTVACAKAYDTKVGTHDFITQMPDAHPLAQYLKTLEYGTSTGRQRMVGWFDAVEKGDALRYGGFQDLVINKLDALTYQKTFEGAELLICVAYQDPDGKKWHSVPHDDAIHKTLKPVYIQLPGWKEDISGIRNFNTLPHNAKIYVAMLMKSIINSATHKGPIKELPNLRYIGVGPDRGQIIDDVPKTKELIEHYTNLTNPKHP